MLQFCILKDIFSIGGDLTDLTFKVYSLLKCKTHNYNIQILQF